jgi:hypothetical protein
MNKFQEFLGIENEEEALSCFLNSAVQAIYHMYDLNLSLDLFSACISDPRHTCVVCCLIRLLDQYSSSLFSNKAPIFTTELRSEVAQLSSSDLFPLQKAADSMEALLTILTHIHYAFLDNNCNSNQLDNEICSCPVHKAVAFTSINKFSCKCGQTNISQTSTFVLNFSTEQYKGDYNELKQNLNQDVPYTFQHLERFVSYFKAQLSESENQTCDCGEKMRFYQKILTLPKYIIVQLIWRQGFTSPLQNLELLVSLNLSFKMSELYPTATAASFSLSGMIVSQPGHYFYVGRIGETWWEANDSVVKEIGTFVSLYSFFNSCSLKIVGLIFHQEAPAYEPIRSPDVISSIEEKMDRLSECLSCKMPLNDEECDNCGYKPGLFDLEWVCSNCDLLNPSCTLACSRCSIRRFIAKESKCRYCEVKTEYLACELHMDCLCCKCQRPIQPRQACFCLHCGKELEYTNSRVCSNCNIDTNKGTALCYLCADSFWRCPQCIERNFLSLECGNCGFNRTDKHQFCTKHNGFCGSGRSDCRKNPDPNEYCTICGTYKIKQICKCNYSFTCRLCHENKMFGEILRCWKCKREIHNGECAKCIMFIPREWKVCESCLYASKDGISTKMMLTSNKTSSQCINCGRLVEDNFFFCCYCRDCLFCSFNCNTCRIINFGESCRNCLTPEDIALIIPSWPKKLTKPDDWDCIHCNYINERSVMFCEKCDYFKNYSFIRQFKCEFCGELSHNRLCKKCFWLYYCSNCEKKIYKTQSAHCGECGSATNDQFCEECNEFVPRSRILCRICSSSMRKCQCGNKCHPKGLLCKWCHKTNSLLPIECRFCNREVKLDYCCFCGSENFGGQCKNCLEENSDQNDYYCRDCCLSGKKCRICKQRRWQKQCCKTIKDKKCTTRRFLALDSPLNSLE